jgi:hypothetical protein
MKRLTFKKSDGGIMAEWNVINENGLGGVDF